MDIFDEKGVFYVGQFVKTVDGINGNGVAYYLSGIVVNGNFLHGLPEGDVTITHPVSGVRERVFVANGCRSSTEEKPSLITFGNGYQLKVKVEDLSPQLFQRTIPYIRNFYHASYFDMGRSKLTFLPSQEDVLNPLPSEVALWSVQHFDIQQPSMVVDVSNPSLSPLKDYYEDEWFASEKSNSVESISLICHSIAKKFLMNYMMTENTRFRHLNQFMSESVVAAHYYIISKEEADTYTLNMNFVLKVLEKSSKLKSLELVAFPFNCLLMKNFDSLWRRLQTWVLKRKYFRYYDYDCFF